MKKRILALVLGLVMMTSGLYGCAGESKDTKEESKGEETGSGRVSFRLLQGRQTASDHNRCGVFWG